MFNRYKPRNAKVNFSVDENIIIFFSSELRFFTCSLNIDKLIITTVSIEYISTISRPRQLVTYRDTKYTSLA